jgi:peptidoglycan/LPS O-acetylase OafA/YrhL
MINGAVAVVLFFMISGFYMAMVINETYSRGRQPGWVMTFYGARLWRLFPAYLATLASMVVWFHGTNGPNPFAFHSDGPVADHVLLMLPNLLMIGQDWHQFLTRVLVEHAGPQWLIDFLSAHGTYVLGDQYMAIGHAWSLSSEICFYLVAPFIVTSRKRTFAVTAVALLFRFILLTVFEQRGGIWGYYFFPGAFCMFMMGAASYHVNQMMPRRDLHRRIGAAALSVFLVWFLGMALHYKVLMQSRADWSIDQPKFWLLYVLFAFFMPFVFALTKDVDHKVESSSWRVNYRALMVRWDRQLGDLSYALYLIHGIVVGIIYYRWNAPQGQPADMIVAVLASIVAAALLNRYVEQPAERWRRKWASRRLERADRFVPDDSPVSAPA